MKRFGALAREGRLGTARVIADRRHLFDRGDPANDAYFLEHGALEIVQSNECGREIVVKILVGPTTFGTIEVMGKESHYLESVRALGSARVHKMDCAAFLALLGRDPQALLELTTDVSRAFCVAARFEAGRLFEADVLLANLLIAYGDVFGVRSDQGLELRIKRSQTELAQAIGASERQVNRLISDWRQCKKLDKRAAKYILRDERYFADQAAPLRSSLIHRAA